MHTGDLVNKPGGIVTSWEPPQPPGLPAARLPYFPRSPAFHQTEPNRSTEQAPTNPPLL